MACREGQIAQLASWKCGPILKSLSSELKAISNFTIYAIFSRDQLGNLDCIELKKYAKEGCLRMIILVERSLREAIF